MDTLNMSTDFMLDGLRMVLNALCSRGSNAIH